MSLANGAPTSTTTTTYATQGRILEEWARNPDGLEWVMSDTYDSAALNRTPSAVLRRTMLSDKVGLHSNLP